MKNLFRILALSALIVSVGIFTACNNDDVKIDPLELGFDGDVATVAESSDPVTVSISFPAAQIAASVTATVGGTAVYGTDYTTDPAVESDEITLSAAKGDTELSFTFTPIDDDAYNEDLTVVVTLVADTGIELGDHSTLTITLTNEDLYVNEEITVGDGVFNMGNFVASYDQIFKSDKRWAWSYEHEIVDGVVMSSTSTGHVYGGYGLDDEDMIATHTFNDDGAIISSTRVDFTDDAAGITSGACSEILLEYTYNSEGYIASVQKTKNESDYGTVEFTYNDDGQLTEKLHVESMVVARMGESKELYTYNDDGMVSSYDDGEGDYYEYQYTDGNMTTEIVKNNEELYTTNTYSYDSEGRIISETYNYYEYSTETYTEEYTATTGSYSSYDEDGDIIEKYIYGEGGAYLEDWYYNYEGGGPYVASSKRERARDGARTRASAKQAPEDFIFLIKTTYGDYFIVDNSQFRVSRSLPPSNCSYSDNKPVKKEYYDGSISSPTLQGYAVINSRDEYYKKTNESVYDNTGTLLYTLVFSNFGEFKYDSAVITEESSGEEITLETMLDSIEWYADLFPNAVDICGIC